MERKKESRLFKIKQKHKINVRGVDFIATSFNGNDVSLKNLEPLFYFFILSWKKNAVQRDAGSLVLLMSLVSSWEFSAAIRGGHRCNRRLI